MGAVYHYLGPRVDEVLTVTSQVALVTTRTPFWKSQYSNAVDPGFIITAFGLLVPLVASYKEIVPVRALFTYIRTLDTAPVSHCVVVAVVM
jgi:hypothetical protein